MNNTKHWKFRITASTIAVAGVLAFVGKATIKTTHDEIFERLAAFTEFRDPSDLITDVRVMESKSLESGRSARSIWSGDYWPLRYGGIAAPYKNGYRTGLIGKVSWKHNRKKFDKKWARQDPRDLSPSQVAALAPSEKLDLLLGDYDLTLSRNVWQMVEEQVDRWGKTKSWEGVCHGWATAAIDAPRPVKTVVVRSADGRYDIPFYPDDIKGLSSWLWANSLAQDYTRGEGRRCNNKNRKFDPITGMSNDPTCNGVDPAIFHLALVNLLGQRGESFVINKNNDLQVWNQPLVSYKYQWFNLNTGKKGPIEHAITLVGDLNSDVRRATRAPEVKYLIGVSLRVEYAKETKPTRSETDHPSHDKIRKLDYIYDLELDSQFRVIGGEWRNFRTDQEAINNAEVDEQADFPGFPGFIWKLQRAARAVSIDVDLKSTERWSPGSPIPNFYLDRSKKASEFRYMIFEWDKDGNPVWGEDKLQKIKYKELRSQPLSIVVHGLLRAAKANDDDRDPR